MTNQEIPAFGKKALFIGGTGVISTAVCRRALDQGWHMTVLNRGRSGAQTPDPDFDAWCDRVLAARQAAEKAFESALPE